ncbi:MAG: phosphatidate cytidylyltransferase [Alphaproteobacteria bacterium]
MALRASETGFTGLVPRLVSVLVLAPLALGLVWAGGIAFDVLVVAAAVLMAYEWHRLCNDGDSAVGAAVAALSAAPVVMIALGRADFAIVAVVLLAALGAAFAGRAHIRRLWAVTGVIYVSVPCIAMIWLRADPALGLQTVFWLFAVVWATDIGAYAAGRGIGGPKLAPRISPKKTWAGLAGGIVSAAVVGAVAAGLLGLPNPIRLVLFSAGLALVAQAGDLWESAVKRRFDKKDSGRLIPGHGGLLDRLDGLLAVAPVAAVTALLGGESVLAWR